jgi:hypothetical protein
MERRGSKDKVKQLSKYRQNQRQNQRQKKLDEDQQNAVQTGGVRSYSSYRCRNTHLINTQK